MAGSHITIALLVLLTMYSVDASAIMKAPDIEDINNLDVCVDISPNCAINAFQCDTNAYVQERCMKTCNLCTNGHKEGTCSADMFECPDGSCIRQAYLCDGYNDCGDDTDEQNCQNSNITCSSDEFQCGDGACILNSQKCDHIADCFDAEDEDHCHTCSSDEFQCGDGACILKSQKCDHIADCFDAADEDHCHNITCSSNVFQCDDGACFLKSQKCDHIADCIDAEDEDHCLVSPDLAFNKAVTTSCPDGFDYIDSCDKCLTTNYYEDPSRCDNCVVCGGFTSCDYYSCISKSFNTTTCMCEARREYEPEVDVIHVLLDTASRCQWKSVPYAPKCDLCAECPVDDCQMFNHKTCRCLTKFKCRARHAKLKTCSDPKAKYVGKCGKCAACPDKCQWFNERTCKCQIATSWEGCTD